ncbi:MAG: hypothetical protein ACE5R6_10490 [Candidatus Heimdallarchaeota archaeon]
MFAQKNNNAEIFIVSFTYACVLLTQGFARPKKELLVACPTRSAMFPAWITTMVWWHGPHFGRIRVRFQKEIQNSKQRVDICSSFGMHVTTRPRS